MIIPPVQTPDAEISRTGGDRQLVLAGWDARRRPTDLVPKDEQSFASIMALAATVAPEGRDGWRRFQWSVAVRLLLGLLLALGLLLDDWTHNLSQPRNVAAQAQGFTITVYDYTGRWGNEIKTGVERWDAGLASRGIRLSYSRQPATSCENLNQPASGISVCDTTVAHPAGWVASGEHQAIWTTDSGIQMRGLVQYYRAAPNSDYADMMVCHELGHTLQLMHVPSGTDSCMTSVPKLVSPSSWDIANALSSIPVYDEGGAIKQQKAKNKGKNNGKKGGKGGKKGGKKHRH